jgi:hypothetical protein
VAACSVVECKESLIILKRWNVEVRRYTGMSSCACAGPLDIGHSRAGHLAMGTVAAA